MPNLLECTPYRTTAGFHARAPTNMTYDTSSSRNHVSRLPSKVFQARSSSSLPLLNDQRLRPAVGTRSRGINSFEGVANPGGCISDITSTFEYRGNFQAPNGGGSVSASVISYVERKTNTPFPPRTNSISCFRGMGRAAPMGHLSQIQTNSTRVLPIGFDPHPDSNSTAAMDIDMGEADEGSAEMDIYDDDIRMEGINQDDLDLHSVRKNFNEDRIFTSTTLSTWECFTGPRGKHLFVLSRNTLESQTDTFCVTSAYSQELYLTASSAPAPVDGEVTMAGSGEHTTTASIDFLLSMFATLELNADIGLPTMGSARVGFPQRLIMSAN